MPRFQTQRVIAILSLALLLTSCGHKQTQVQVPPPPPITATPQETEKPLEADKVQPSEDRNDKTTLRVPFDAKPLSVETGRASWYGAPFQNRRTSNGEVYDMNAMTAAHRTLPLGSIVRVTNVKTGNSAVVRITDRGPFIQGRILDLSFAAAKKCDVWGPGIATVKLEVLQTPTPLDSGGRWAVQIGGFGEEDAARDLADHLTRRYHTAKVLSFNSPAGDWWVRVRVQNDDRKRAEDVARDTQTAQGSIFLVRLD
ncbi:MAG TPA: septal ring lytic transglycosylase RlpA family protein [Terriglobales bacterium]|nr:septal ring lytic transglycosylase RlpA family protein [Terriglobales bacterium]